MVIVLSLIVVDSIDSISGTVKQNRLYKFSATHASIQEKSKYFWLGIRTISCGATCLLENTMGIKFSVLILPEHTMSISFFGVLVYVVRYFDILLFYFFFVGIVVNCTVPSIWCFYICNLYFSIIRRYSKYNLI
jgi:hypothetical protein